MASPLPNMLHPVPTLKGTPGYGPVVPKLDSMLESLGDLLNIRLPWLYHLISYIRILEGVIDISNFLNPLR